MLFGHDGGVGGDDAHLLTPFEGTHNERYLQHTGHKDGDVDGVGDLLLEERHKTAGSRDRAHALGLQLLRALYEGCE